MFWNGVLFMLGLIAAGVVVRLAVEFSQALLGIVCGVIILAAAMVWPAEVLTGVAIFAMFAVCLGMGAVENAKSAERLKERARLKEMERLKERARRARILARGAPGLRRSAEPLRSFQSSQDRLGSSR